jgi:hypothetical protein
MARPLNLFRARHSLPSLRLGSKNYVDLMLPLTPLGKKPPLVVPTAVEP